MRCEFDDFRRQPVAVLEAVGDDELDVGAHRAQAAHADRARRRPIGVVVGDDDDPLAPIDGGDEPMRRGVGAFQRRRMRQPVETGIEILRRLHAARGVDTRQHRIDTRAGERCRMRAGGPANDRRAHGGGTPKADFAKRARIRRTNVGGVAVHRCVAAPPAISVSRVK